MEVLFTGSRRLRSHMQSEVEMIVLRNLDKREISGFLGLLFFFFVTDFSWISFLRITVTLLLIFTLLVMTILH